MDRECEFGNAFELCRDISAAGADSREREPHGSVEGAKGMAHEGIVKWFRIDKGYGFVALGGGAGDAFLHLKSLRAVGREFGCVGCEGQRCRRARRTGHSGHSHRRHRRDLRRFGDRSARRARPFFRGRSYGHGQMVRRRQGLRLCRQRRLRPGRVRPLLGSRPLGRLAPRPGPDSVDAGDRDAERPGGDPGCAVTATEARASPASSDVTGGRDGARRHSALF